MSRRNNNIQPPKEPVPEEYKNIVPKDVLPQRIDVPKATLHGSKNNLKRIRSFKKLRQKYKVSNQKTIFINDMKAMLDHMDKEENRLDIDLLVEVNNIAESFFIYGSKEEREQSKKEAVQELLLPYFFDNETILETMISSVSYKIKKSNIFRRCYSRVYNFFFCHEKR